MAGWGGGKEVDGERDIGSERLRNMGVTVEEWEMEGENGHRRERRERFNRSGLWMLDNLGRFQPSTLP